MNDMKNTATIDIEDYYNLRRTNEALENTLKELEKKEVEREKEMQILKQALISIATFNPSTMMDKPPFNLDYEVNKLVIKIDPPKGDSRFKDVVVVLK